MIHPPKWTTQILRPLARAADFVLDPSILFSFDQSGYLRHRVQFNEMDLNVDMTGRVCLVTGGNSGLGLAAARALARRAATVWILARNEERSEREVRKLRRETGNSDIHHARIDLASPESISDFSSTIQTESVDVLINNAGVLLNERETTSTGIERTLATNLTGHLALTAALMPLLRAGTRSRVIWVASGGMYTKKLDVDLLCSPAQPFDGIAAYAQTKRAMVTISMQMAERLKSQGVAVHCMHPGWAATRGVEQSLPRFWQVTRPILRTPTAGADTIVWLAVCDQASEQPGLFWFDRRPRPVHLLPHTRHTDEEADLLWTKVHQWAAVNPAIWTTS